MRNRNPFLTPKIGCNRPKSMCLRSTSSGTVPVPTILYRPLAILVIVVRRQDFFWLPARLLNHVREQTVKAAFPPSGPIRVLYGHPGRVAVLPANSAMEALRVGLQIFWCTEGAESVDCGNQCSNQNDNTDHDLFMVSPYQQY